MFSIKQILDHVDKIIYSAKYNIFDYGRYTDQGFYRVTELIDKSNVVFRMSQKRLDRTRIIFEFYIQNRCAIFLNTHKGEIIDCDIFKVYINPSNNEIRWIDENASEILN